MFRTAVAAAAIALMLAGAALVPQAFARTCYTNCYGNTCTTTCF